VANDFSSFTGDFQVWMTDLGSRGTIARNSFGPADSAGVKCHGRDNQFVNNHFYGPYRGWTSAASGPGLFWFTLESHANTVAAAKLNDSPHGFDLCGQVLDETDNPATPEYDGVNNIPGYEKCRLR
jgi:hypothetical protein